MKEKLLLFKNCYLCFVSNSSTPIIKQSQVAELMSKTFVARIKVSSIKQKLNSEQNPEECDATTDDQ